MPDAITELSLVHNMGRVECHAFKVMLKILIISIVLGGLLWSRAYSQARMDSTGQKNKVDISNYLSLLDEKARLIKEHPSRNSTDSVIKSMSIGELKSAAGLMFRASDADAAGINDSLTARADRFMQDYSKGIRGGVKPGFVEVKILDEVKKQISSVVYALLQFDFLLDVRVTKVEAVPGGLSLMPNAKRTVVTASVLQVHKGTGKLKPGDQIQFYYYDIRLSHKVTFEPGRDYLIPLDYTLAWYTGFDKSETYYPIENGMLTDSSDLFGFGNRLELKTFEAKLDSLITEVKSW